MSMKQIQRVRDPVHDLIPFDNTALEQMLWRVIQTSPFQRLRRVRQLGFSELVYPGATHTRFAHSLGVFHTARQLMAVAKRSQGEAVHGHQINVALTAALLHDIGHGMFSHAFEDVGKKLGLKMAHHEHVSSLLIRENPEIQKAVGSDFGTSFLSDVANVIEQKGIPHPFHSVVSSQFDGDRLDYMQRDRLMTGVQGSSIDFSWLINNLELAEITSGVDDEKADDTLTTFVLGPKAVHAAEAYVLSLFQLYPTVYFHKTTRGAEKLFSQILLRIAELQQDESGDKTGLGSNHPIRRFFADSEKIDHALALDDTVFWGALPELKQADDSQIKTYASWLSERQLPKCFDVFSYIQSKTKVNELYAPKNKEEAMQRAGYFYEAKERSVRIQANAKAKINEWIQGRIADVARANKAENFLVLDDANRNPYKKSSDSTNPLNQIYVQPTKGQAHDLADVSPLVANLEPYPLLRVYFAQAEKSKVDTELKQIIDRIIEEESGNG